MTCSTCNYVKLMMKTVCPWGQDERERHEALSEPHQPLCLNIIVALVLNLLLGMQKLSLEV